MREHLGFLHASSAVVKIAAWIILILGLVSGTGIFLGLLPSEPRWKGLMISVSFFLIFCFLYIIAKIAELLTKIINEIHEIKKE